MLNLYCAGDTTDKCIHIKTAHLNPGSWIQFEQPCILQCMYTHALLFSWLVCMLCVIIWSAQTYVTTLSVITCSYPDMLFLSVLVNVLVKWHGNQKSCFFSSRVWLESMVVCKELSLPCPHNSRLMWKWHGWNLWLAWTCLFKSCIENNGGLFLRQKNYFSGRETRKTETEKLFIRHFYQPAWWYHTEKAQHEGLGLFTLVI